MATERNGTERNGTERNGTLELFADENNVKHYFNYLMVDTALFGVDFKARLLKAVDNLDECVDGVLVHGDNFQGLSLLQERYKEQVKCIYIDPPYNTSASEIIYKNNYKHSSWATLIYNRVSISKNFLSNNGVKIVAIDDAEMVVLSQVLDDVCVGYDRNMVIVNHHPAGAGLEGTNISPTHEYAIFMIPTGKKILFGDSHLEDTSEIGFIRTGTADSNLRVGRPNSFYAVLVNTKTSKVVGVEQPPKDNSYLRCPTEEGFLRIYPVSSDGTERVWRRSYESALQEISDGKIICKGNKSLYLVSDTKGKHRPIFSNWTETKYNAGAYGTNLLSNMVGKSLFSYPKSLFNVMDCVGYSTKKEKNELVMDYFGGSGTTAHAVINLNRQDAGQRKYILMEQGEYFDTVLKPRIQKVVFSENWKEGKAQANNTGNFNGISHAFKVLKIESYEDTLNNLQLIRSKGQADLLNQMQPQERSQYLMHYMLKLESKGSLLSVTDFLKPFGYQLNITTDSAGAYQTRTVDLVETFNYLLGLRVKQIDMQLDKGFVQVIGTLPNGESALIFWRDCDKINYEQLNKLLDKLHINPRDTEYDVIYVNGDHNIPTVFQSTIDEGGITRTQKIRQIESEFLDKMFAGA